MTKLRQKLKKVIIGSTLRSELFTHRIQRDAGETIFNAVSSIGSSVLCSVMIGVQFVQIVIYVVSEMGKNTNRGMFLATIKTIG